MLSVRTADPIRDTIDDLEDLRGHLDRNEIEDARGVLSRAQDHLRDVEKIVGMREALYEEQVGMLPRHQARIERNRERRA